MIYLNFLNQLFCFERNEKPCLHNNSCLDLFYKTRKDNSNVYRSKGKKKNDKKSNVFIPPKNYQDKLKNISRVVYFRAYH